MRSANSSIDWRLWSKKWGNWDTWFQHSPRNDKYTWPAVNPSSNVTAPRLNSRKFRVALNLDTQPPCRIIK